MFYRLAPHLRNPYASPMLDLIGGILDDDPIIDQDRRRLERITAIPVQQLCGMGPDIFDEPASRPAAALARRKG